MDFSRLERVHAKFGGKVVDVKPGQYLEIHEEIGQGDTKRIWKFKGLVIKVWNSGHADGTFTIKGTTSGVEVEKIYPLCFPNFKKIVLLDEFKVRKSKLYFMRNKVGKGARLKSAISADRRNIDLLIPKAEIVADVVEETNEA